MTPRPLPMLTEAEVRALLSRGPRPCLTVDPACGTDPGTVYLARAVYATRHVARRRAARRARLAGALGRVLLLASPFAVVAVLTLLALH